MNGDGWPTLPFDRFRDVVYLLFRFYEDDHLAAPILTDFSEKVRQFRLFLVLLADFDDLPNVVIGGQR